MILEWLLAESIFSFLSLGWFWGLREWSKESFWLGELEYLKQSLHQSTSSAEPVGADFTKTWKFHRDQIILVVSFQQLYSQKTGIRQLTFKSDSESSQVVKSKGYTSLKPWCLRHIKNCLSTYFWKISFLLVYCLDFFFKTGTEIIWKTSLSFTLAVSSCYWTIFSSVTFIVLTCSSNPRLCRVCPHPIRILQCTLYGPHPIAVESCSASPNRINSLN